ncbi:MAG: 2-hydroxychromene-2-carboxylate isomerase, partial [Burkholderiaceae bacterium]
MDFFFFIGSTYSYLSVVRAESAAAQAGVELVWRPFSVRTLMREQNNVPFSTKPAKMRYMWRDIER